MATWKHKPKNIDDYKGFIYLITNEVTGMKYIGKKKFWFKRTRKPLKGKKRKRVEFYESDWKNYYGSSNSLSEDIKKYGKKNFTREILQCYKTEWECTYHEARLQFEHEVLFDPMYYNKWIKVKLGARKCVQKKKSKN